MEMRCRVTLALVLLVGPASAQIGSVGVATGDVDRDGNDDVAVAWPHETGRNELGTVHVLDGATGAKRWSVSGTPDVRCVGLGVAIVDEDVDEPLVVIASRDLSSGQLDLDVHRAADGARASAIRLPATAEEWSCHIVPLGDVDGDGVSELAVGRPQFSRAAHYSGRISIVSLLDGCEVADLEGTRERERLGSNLARGRFDDDTRFDLVTLRDDGVAWLSVPALRELGRLSAHGRGGNLGTSLVTLGDVNGDGKDEIAVGRREPNGREDWGTSRSGEARVHAVGESEPLSSVRVEAIDDKGPILAAIHSRARLDACIAFGSPWERGSSGIWRIFDSTSRVVAQQRSDTHDYYAVALAACRTSNGGPDRLIVISESQDCRVNYVRRCAGVQCWGGEAWDRMEWQYKLDPDAVYMP
jgi:hypothetical protein